MFRWHYEVGKRQLTLTSRQDYIPQNFSVFCRTYLADEGETGNDLMVRVFKVIAHSVTSLKAQGEIYLEVEDECWFENPVSKKIFALTAENIVPVDVRPAFGAGIVFADVAPRPEIFQFFLREWSFRAQCHYSVRQCTCPSKELSFLRPENHVQECLETLPARICLDDPYYLAGSAFVSGGSPEGVYEALANMRLNAMVPHSDNMNQLTKDVLISLAHTFKVVGVDHKELPPGFNEYTFNYDFKPDKSAGYFNVYKETFENIDGEVVRLANTTRQSDAYYHTLSECLKIARKINSEVQKEPKYKRSWFPILVAKISVKPEVREPGANEFKTRVFFIMSMIKLLIDKELFSQPMKYFYGKDFCAIGHKWKSGGARRFRDDVKGDDKDRDFFCFDISKLDQRLFASMLTLIFTAVLTFYSKQNPHAYNVLRAFLCWSVDDIATSLVKWLGMSYRYIVGVMFSGLYVTSWGDTLYLTIPVKCAVIEFYRRNKISPYTPGPIIKLYGDNGFISWDRKLLHQFIGDDVKTGFFYTYMSDVWGLPLKLDETSYHSCFYTTVVNEQKDCVWRSKIVAYGPFFLKRRFIRHPDDKNDVIAYRPSRDYYVKSMTTNSFNHDPSIWLARWCGLLLDTMGSNPEASQYLRFLIQRMIDYLKLPNTPQQLEETVLAHPSYWNERVLKHGDVPPDFIPMLLEDGSLRDFFS